MSRIRTLFLGTPEIARNCLEGLIKDEHFEVVGVITQPDRPSGRKMKPQPSAVRMLADTVGLPVLTPENINSEDSLAEIRKLKAEVAVVVAYGQILKLKFLELFPQKVVNLHASLLPRWRGAAPIQRALIEGDLETGVSLQVVVPKLDAGPVLGERRFALTLETSAIDVFRKSEELGVQLLTVDLMDYLRGNLTPVAQDESLVTYAKKIESREASIDWSRSAEQIHNQVRGLALGPVAQSRLKGKLIKLHQTQIATGQIPSGEPGEVVEVGADSLLVKCGSGGLKLLQIQPESRSRMSAQDFLRGYATRVGDRFEPS